MSLKDYVVHVPSVWYTPYHVRAAGRKDAIQKVRDGKGTCSDSAEYERQLGPDEWKWVVDYENRPFKVPR